jgi:radical SAM protein with 4Fe4S-binding SPASM domain
MAMPELPGELQVEVTGACNLRCRMCLVRYAPAVGRRDGALDLEQFLGLLDELPALTKLTLQGLGEPLLSPHLLEMVEAARARRIAVGFNSNGVLLDRATAERLVAAGLSWLHVSLDGATAATYADVRHGTDLRAHPRQFERVVANLRELLAVRARAGRAEPRVLLVFVAMRRNLGELEALVDLADELGVDELWVQNLSHTFADTATRGGDPYGEIRRYSARESLVVGDARARAEAVFARAAARASAIGLPLRLPRLTERPLASAGRRAGERGCDFPWTSTYVTHRGVVQPCCMVMGSDRATLGDLHDGSFAEIWEGEAYRDFRRRLVGDEPPEVCGGCSLYRGVF